jgi:transposase
MAAMRGIAKASLTNGVRADAKRPLAVTPEAKPTAPTRMPEHAEIARLRAQVTRLTMERDIETKAAVYFAQNVLQGKLGFSR